MAPTKTAARAKAEPLTNKEFADAIGIHHTMASRIKNGIRMPGVDTIQRIADVYGIKIETLLAARKRGAESFGRLVRKEIYAKGLRPRHR